MTDRRGRWRLAPALALALAGCGDGGGGDSCPLTEPRVDVEMEVYSGGGYEGLRVTLAAQHAPDPRAAIRCQTRAAGPCTVVTCSGVGVDFVDGEPTCIGASTGALSLRRASGATLTTPGNQQLALQPPASPGEALTLRTSGADVPAFEASLALPRRTTVTEPAALAAGRDLALRAGEDLTVRWAPTSSRVRVVLVTQNGGSSTATCDFDGASGAGTVPAGAIPAGTGHVLVSTMEEARLRAGAYPVAVRALWSTGARAPYATGS